MDVIASVGGCASALARFRRPFATPFATLDTIDRIAIAIGVRYVLWVEDLERFAVGNPAQPHPESQDEAERLAPIRALLHGLDRLQAVTVVTATTSLYQRFDLEKIARYVERVPHPEPLQVREVVQAFRKAWHNEEGVIDPIGAAARDKIGWSQGKIREDLMAVLGDGIVTLADACTALCETPRILKQALRRCDEIWAKLSGEIHLDSVLAMSFVREATPSGLAIVEQHVNRIRNPPIRRRTEPDTDAVTSLEEALNAAKLPARAIKAVRVIVKETIATRVLQGFFYRNPTDYWQRFMAIPALRVEERDQETLKAIDGGDGA